MARLHTHTEQSEQASSDEVLTPQELSECEQVARRMHSELRPVIDALPMDQRGASAMSRLLGVDRAVCQRFVFTLSKREPDARSLVDLPGPDGIRSIISAAARKKLIGGDALASSKAAVERFQEVIEAHAGSQRKLKARLDAASPVAINSRVVSTSGDEALSTRKRMFAPSCEVTGRWSETLLSMRFIRVHGGNDGTPAVRESAFVRGYLGHVARPDAIAMETGESRPLFSPGAREPGFKTLSEDPAASTTADLVLPEYSSHPMPRVVTRTDHARLLHLIDIPEDQLGKPNDIVIAGRESQQEPHPASWRPPIAEVGLLTLYPARRLLLDVFLHRDLASKCIASASAHLWTPDQAVGRACRWSTRLRGNLPLKLLGFGLSNLATPHFARQQDLAADVYRRMDWDPDEFVGYRLEVSYPIWRAGYYEVFDFTGNELPAADPKTK